MGFATNYQNIINKLNYLLMLHQLQAIASKNRTTDVGT